MKTRDKEIRALAWRAECQCDVLVEKMDAILYFQNYEDESEAERLCGIGRDEEGRARLVFSETVVYVDAILALAQLLNGEPQVEELR